MADTQEYWNRRARQDKIKVIKTAEYGVDNLKKLLKKNLDSVEKQIKEFYKKYGDEGKYAESLSYAEFQKYKAKLRLKAKQNPQDKTLQRLAKQDIPKYRIDRLRALQTDLQIQLTEATRGQEAGIYKTLKDVAKVSQATTALRFKKTLDVAFDKIASRKLEKILSSDWVGNMNWSERLWKDRELVGKKVTDILEEGIPQGKSMQSMARNLKDATQSSFNDAFRLIRTESAHVDGEVLLESFKQAKAELGYTKYIFDATIDNRTSKICADEDNKSYYIDEAVIGENFPPLHPNCRSTAVLDESSIDESLIEESKQEEKEEETQEEFKPATTKEEAKEYANKFVKDGNSTFDNDITLDNLNQFNEQMTYLTKKYNYDEFTTVGSFVSRSQKDKVIMHANRTLLEVEKDFGARTKAEFESLWKSQVENWQSDRQRWIKEYSKFIGVSGYDQKKINKYIKGWTKEAKFTRHNAFSSVENQFTDALTHEFGHSLMFRAINKEIKAGGTYKFGNVEKYNLSKQTTKTYKLLEETLKKAQKTGDIYKISEYANTNPDEFFAECFAIYERGVEKLPEYVNNMIKEVLSI
jgi:SPP1 gp7 family putative phage head morphogenesis protein